MPPRRSPAPKRQFRKLHIGPWLARLDRSQAEAADAVGVSKPYMSELISGKKKNPGYQVLHDLAAWLGITIDDLFRPPPDKRDVDAVDPHMSASEMAALGTVLERVRKAGR